MLLHITALRHQQLLTLQEAGLVLAVSAAAAFAAPLLVGILARRLGHQATGWAGLGALLLGLALLSTSLTPTALVAAVLLLGLAYASVVVLGSAELATHGAHHTHALIALQYGATAIGGVLAGPLFAWLTAVAARPTTPTPPSWALSVVAPLAAAAILPSLLRRDYGARNDDHGASLPLRLQAVWLLLLLGGLHGACDVGSYNWMPLWLQERAQASQALVATFISVTWLASLLGRGLTILLASRLGSGLALRLSSTGATLCLACVLWGRTPWTLIVAYAAYLVFSAGNVPGLMASANTRYPQWRAELNGLTLTAINGAGALMTYTLGRLGEAQGSFWGGLSLPLTAMALFAVLTWSGAAGRVNRKVSPMPH